MIRLLIFFISLALTPSSPPLSTTNGSKCRSSRALYAWKYFKKLFPLWFWQHRQHDGVVFLLTEHSTILLLVLKSITPHLPSLASCLTKRQINQHEIPASCFVGFRLDTTDIDGAGAVWMCVCSWDLRTSVSALHASRGFLQVLRCRSRKSSRAPQ